MPYHGRFGCGGRSLLEFTAFVLDVAHRSMDSARHDWAACLRIELLAVSPVTYFAFQDRWVLELHLPVTFDACNQPTIAATPDLTRTLDCQERNGHRHVLDQRFTVSKCVSTRLACRGLMV